MVDYLSAIKTIFIIGLDFACSADAHLNGYIKASEVL